jgi:hypothetical protein
MSRNSCKFPDRALFIHPSIIFVGSILSVLNISIVFYPYRFVLGLFFSNLYLVLVKYRPLLFMYVFPQ